MSAEIRVFVSGTFADFQAERALLHRLVWPTIRERCAARRRRLVDIDLRWGVPANSSPRQTLLVCLSEVRRADVVVCLLGARYGWVPDAADAAAAWAELGEEGVPSPLSPRRTGLLIGAAQRSAAKMAARPSLWRLVWLASLMAASPRRGCCET